MVLLAGRGEAALHARLLPDLSRLIYPIDFAAFEREHWERKPLLVQRNDPDYYADLLTLDDIDEVLALSGARVESLRVVVDGTEVAVSELASSYRQNVLEAVYEKFRTGSTVVLNGLEQRWEPLAWFARALGGEIGARIQTNIYVTPPGNQGFAPHYDMHDVFVAQVHGSKHWRLASQPYELPLQTRPYDKSQPEPEPEREIDLRAGDLLYLPRGTVHSATANDATSVHITIGVHPILYSGVIEDAVKQLFADDIRFRKGLPIGFATEPARQRQAVDALGELLDAVRQLAPTELVAEATARTASLGLPALRHHLTDLAGLDRIDLGTRVRRRPGLRYHLTVGDDAVSVAFHGKTVQLPVSVTEEVRYVASSNGDGCTAATIPGDLDEQSRLVLITTLVREGFLTCG